MGFVHKLKPRGAARVRVCARAKMTPSRARARTLAAAWATAPSSAARSSEGPNGLPDVDVNPARPYASASASVAFPVTAMVART